MNKRQKMQTSGGSHDLPRVLLTGDVDYRDFDQPREWLDVHTRLTTKPKLDQAHEWIGQATPAPRVIVVAQSRPGQFDAERIERLHAAAPLARLFALLGSWCEGEARSGHPWPGITRVYWHQWCARIPTELENIDVNMAGNLPRTATATERLLMQTSSGTTQAGGLVAIDTLRYADYSALAATCSLAGFSTLWIGTRQAPIAGGIDAVLWDGWSGTSAELDPLRRLVASRPALPVVALLSFPRREDVARARHAGAAAVISKPFMNQDLRYQLERAIAGVSHATSANAA